MIFATDHSVFSIPLRHLWSTGLSGNLELLDRPSNGLNRFVGDQPNHLLRMLADSPENQQVQLDDLSNFWPLVLFGPAGTGKTSIALALMAKYIDDFSQAAGGRLSSSDRRADKSPANDKLADFGLSDFGSQSLGSFKYSAAKPDYKSAYGRVALRPSKDTTDRHPNPLTDGLNRVKPSNKQKQPRPTPVFHPDQIGPGRFRPTILTAIDLERRYRSAVITDTVVEFHQRIIRSQGLLLDNFHQLSNKTSLQQELIQIIDQMLEHRYPIIITMDRNPLKCQSLMAQLASRLCGGLCLPVQQPGERAREVILQDLCQIHQIDLEPTAIEFLVHRLQVSVPRMIHFFGQLKLNLQLRATGSTGNSWHNGTPSQPTRSVDLEMVEQMFELSDIDRRRLADVIVVQVAAELKLKPKELAGHSRKQGIVFGRSIAIYLIRQLLGSSFLKIGSLLGNRDHTTIMHAYRKIDALLTACQSGTADTNAMNAHQQIEKLRQRLNNLFANEIALHP